MLAFPVFSFFRTFTFFTCACDSELLVVEGLLRAFSILSKCFLFFNLPYNIEKHLVPKQYIKGEGNYRAPETHKKSLQLKCS